MLSGHSYGALPSTAQECVIEVVGFFFFSILYVAVVLLRALKALVPANKRWSCWKWSGLCTAVISPRSVHPKREVAKCSTCVELCNVTLDFLTWGSLVVVFTGAVCVFVFSNWRSFPLSSFKLKKRKMCTWTSNLKHKFFCYKLNQ